MREPITVACMQAEPAILDRERTIDKVAALTAEAAAGGAQLAPFAEAIVPVYPSNRWVRFLAAGGDAKPVFARLACESVEIPGPESDRLAEVAREYGVWLAPGASELDRSDQRVESAGAVRALRVGRRALPDADGRRH